MKFLSIDLETLDVEASAVVLSVGLCFVDTETGAEDCAHFALPVQPQIELGRSISARTIGWWLQQSDAARASVYMAFQNSDLAALQQGATAIARIIAMHEVDEVWGYGASFDVSILESLFNDLDIEIPWTYKQVRCLRTAAALISGAQPKERVGTYHNALDDAVYQARWITNIKDRLNDSED